MVYCLEEVDNPKGFDQLQLETGTTFEVVDAPELLGGVKLIKAQSGKVRRAAWNEQGYNL